jgi:hypothetical protein
MEALVSAVSKHGATLEIAAQLHLEALSGRT